MKSWSTCQLSQNRHYEHIIFHNEKITGVGKNIDYLPLIENLSRYGQKSGIGLRMLKNSSSEESDKYETLCSCWVTDDALQEGGGTLLLLQLLLLAPSTTAVAATTGDVISAPPLASSDTPSKCGVEEHVLEQVLAVAHSVVACGLLLETVTTSHTDESVGIVEALVFAVVHKLLILLLL